MSVSLCHRCEHRARALEEGHGPRYECTQTFSVHSCYMYRPTAPLALCRLKGDRRPLGAGWSFSARATGEPWKDPKLRMEDRNGQLLQWWTPKPMTRKAKA